MDIPRAQFEIISGAAHRVSMEKSKEFNRLALEFLIR